MAGRRTTKADIQPTPEHDEHMERIRAALGIYRERVALGDSLAAITASLWERGAEWKRTATDIFRLAQTGMDFDEITRRMGVAP